MTNNFLTSDDAIVNNNVELHKFLTTEDIKRLAPKVFCDAPTNPNLSKHYTFASSETVIEDMKKLGWEVVSASQPHPRRHNTVNSFHMVSFQNPEIKITKTMSDGTTVVDCYPRIILTNSHDGFTSFQFRVGIYRVVCNNGLIIATDQFEAVRLRHIHYTFEELRNLVNTITELVPTQVEVMNRMQGRVLTQAEKNHLALTAIRNRSNNPEMEVMDFILEDIVTPVRPEDEGDDLWTVFNVIMEKMMSGEFQIEGKRGLRKARKITSIWKNIHLNQDMFKAAVAMI